MMIGNIKRSDHGVFEGTTPIIFL